MTKKTKKEDIMDFRIGNCAQQGDVILEAVESIENDLKVKKDFVLALGETTGHKHEIDITGLETDLIELYEAKDGQLFVRAKTGFTIKHAEHKPITLPKGNYKVRKVREFDYYKNEARAVRD